MGDDFSVLGGVEGVVFIMSLDIDGAADFCFVA